MPEKYFQRLTRITPTRLWVNNPTVPEAEEAVANAAVSCTTNPAYGDNMLRRDHDQALGIVRECLRMSANDSAVADLVQQRLVVRIAEVFLPVYERSGGRNGFVSIQGNPFRDEDWGHMADEARRYRRLSPNIIAKIPATEAGLKAIETLIAEDVPVIATEVFGLPQMIAACEAYRRASEASGKRPPYYVTHITGIFDEFLQAYAQREKTAIAPDTLAQAGLALARRQYRFFKERGYSGIMLGGGAREIKHFTGLVGGDWHITINWSMAAEIIVLNPAIEDTSALPAAAGTVDELLAKLPDFRRAWCEDGMTPAEFKDYGPVRHFRELFLRGWQALRAAIWKGRERAV